MRLKVEGKMEMAASTGGEEIAEAYLDLLKGALTYSYWSEDPVPVELLIPNARAFKRLPYHWIVQPLLQRFNLQLRRKQDYWPLKAHTMMPRPMLDHLQHCVEAVLEERVPGDLIETGVWRGGACMLMKAVLNVRGEKERKVILADSFAGLPPPRPEEFPADAGSSFHTYDILSVPLEEVRSSFEQFGLLDDGVVFLKGWFRDTLQRVPSNRFALIRLDGDLFESTMQALEALYQKLSPGGFCIIDDYPLPGARAAVEEFRSRSGITETIIDPGFCGYGAYWRKRDPG